MAAVAGFARAAALVRDAGHPHTEMLTLYHLARHHLLDHRPQEALDHARHALTLAPPHEVAARRAMLLDICGQSLLAMGRPVEARDHFERAHRLAEQEGYTELAAECLTRAAAVRNEHPAQRGPQGFTRPEAPGGGTATTLYRRRQARPVRPTGDASRSVGDVVVVLEVLQGVAAEVALGEGGGGPDRFERHLDLVGRAHGDAPRVDRRGLQGLLLRG